VRPRRTGSRRSLRHVLGRGLLIASALALPALSTGSAASPTSHAAVLVTPAGTEPLELPSPSSGRPREYKVKSAFLFNFIRFTTWPKGVFEKRDSPIVMTVVGKDPFGEVLEETFRGKELHGRSIAIKRTAAVQGCKDAHLVFAGKLSEKERAKLLEFCAGRPVLLVGEANGFAQDGASVNFYVDQRKVRFEINTQSTKEAGLTLSSEILKLARIVETRRPR
jgi:hypothetical protein